MAKFFRGKRESLGVQFEHQLATRIKDLSYEKTLAMMEELAHRIVDYFKENREFDNITGNAFTSFYVEVSYKGKRKYLVRSSSGEKSPTRVTLAEGEEYNLPYYYDGNPNDGYVGTAGGGHQWGPNLLYGRAGRIKATGKDWSIVAVCPVEYARFAKLNHIFKTVYATYEAIPDVFDAKVVFAKKSTIEKV